MKRIKESFLQNIIFWIITVLIVLAAFTNRYYSCIGDDPFSSGYMLANPVQAVFSDQYHYYLTDASYTITAANENDELVYEIQGRDPENTFDYADAIAAGSGGILYVHDKSYNEDGISAYRERILKFTNNGRSREVLYEAETSDADGIQIMYLDSPRVIDGTLYFSEITADGIYVKRCAGEYAEECAFMPMDEAYDIVADSSFSNSFEISALLMNGDICTYKNGENIIVYNAREHDTDEYCSFVANIAYGENNVLYINDVGQRIIRAYDGNELTTIVGRDFGNDVQDHFALYPLYSGLNVSGGRISVLSTEYRYDDYLEDYNYFYSIAAMDMNGDVVFHSDTIGISDGRKIITICVYAALLLTAVIAVYAAVKLIGTVIHNAVPQAKTQLLVLITAIAVTIGVSMSLFDSYFEKFADESAANLSNIAYLIDERLDKEIIKAIDNPDKYFDDDYEKLHEDIRSVLKSNTNRNSNIYAVLYKVYNDVLCEIYRSDEMHGIMYPMAGVYSGSIEEDIAADGTCYISKAFELAEGSYTFAEIASYDENGEAVALIEVGTDYNYFVSENNALYRKILIAASMTVIIIMLLFAEFMNGLSAVKARKTASSSQLRIPPEVIRPIAFMIFFTANITTAFLPIYGISLWNNSFSLPAEVAAAFPLSAELIFSALSALVSGSLVKKTGVKPMCIWGSVFYIGGNLLSAFAGNLWILICANSTCGIGGGMLMIAVNTWITAFDDEESRKKGFMYYNAAFLAGMNCGTVIGSIIWENLGIKAAYFTAALGALIIAIFSTMLIENTKASVRGEKANKVSLKYFFTPKMLRYISCFAVPYLVCAAFLSYYFPVAAENDLLSATEISMAFLLSGVISIYSGSTIGESVIGRLGIRKAMILASFIHAVAFLYFVINPSITSCYAVIILFAAADSFGSSAQSVYFISMPEVEKIGQSRALGINSTIESIVSACGPVIFGTALILGERQGIFLIGVIFSALLFLFVVGGNANEVSEPSESK